MQQTNLKKKKVLLYWISKLTYYLFCLFSVKMITTERYVSFYLLLCRKCQNILYFLIKETTFLCFNWKAVVNCSSLLMSHVSWPSWNIKTVRNPLASVELIWLLIYIIFKLIYESVLRNEFELWKNWKSFLLCVPPAPTSGPNLLQYKYLHFLFSIVFSYMFKFSKYGLRNIALIKISTGTIQLWRNWYSRLILKDGSKEFM